MTNYIKFMYFGSMLLTFYPLNPNGSAYGVEAICSPDGRILGKMGHSERIGKNLYRNVYGKYDQKIFESGVNYFKKRQLN